MNKIINWCRGVNNWLNYVRNYKENKDNDLIYDHKLIERHKQIRALQEELARKECLEKERTDLMALREKRIQQLNKKITELNLQKRELVECLAYAQIKMNMLEDKLAKKESSRRKNASAIGGLKAKINSLTKELEQANYTINYYRKSKKPNVEEIKAYEYQRKAVEKRIKDAEK